MNDQIRLQYLLEVMYTWQEAQHTCCAAKKYVQHSLFANKLQNVNLSVAMFCKHRWRSIVFYFGF